MLRIIIGVGLMVGAVAQVGGLTALWVPGFVLVIWGLYGEAGEDPSWW